MTFAGQLFTFCLYFRNVADVIMLYQSDPVIIQKKLIKLLMQQCIKGT